MNPEAKTRILIVEDSSTQAEQLQYILKRNGYDPQVARNGQEALTMLSNTRPALVISDIVMPEMDGYELCHRIRMNEALLGMPVVLLTSLSDPEDIIKGLDCGADNFITKPFDERYLLGMIRHIFSTRSCIGMQKQAWESKYFLRAENILSHRTGCKS